MTLLDWTVQYHGVLSAGAALMSALAAIILLVLGYCQHRWSQTHNKALVKPFLTGVLTSASASSHTFSIVNKGLGTALVDKLEARSGDKTLTMSMLNDRLTKQLPSFVVSVGEFNGQYGFSPNDSFKLVKIEARSTCRDFPEALKEELMSVLQNISIHVKYHSLLDETELSYDSKNDLSIIQTESE